MPSSTTPSLQRLSINNAKAVISALKDDGGLILTDFTTPETVVQVNAETKPYLRADKPWKGALFPPETRRCPRLIARSKTAREQWLANPKLIEILNFFLSKTTQNYYDDALHTYTTEPLLDVATTLEVNPGAKAQRLHRDDKVHHADHFDQTVSGHQMGTDVSMSILIPGITTTRENGATYVRRAEATTHRNCRVNTDSQKGTVSISPLGHGSRPEKADCTFAEMVPGEAILFLGGRYHAGGANDTVDQARPVHAMFFCRGIYRTEEAHHLANSREEVMSWSAEVQKMLGFYHSAPNLGLVDFRSPMTFLRGGYEDDEYIQDPDHPDA